eukprot:738127-Rhodomonas_salina.1
MRRRGLGAEASGLRKEPEEEEGEELKEEGKGWVGQSVWRRRRRRGRAGVGHRRQGGLARQAQAKNKTQTAETETRACTPVAAPPHSRSGCAEPPMLPGPASDDAGPELPSPRPGASLRARKP